MKRTLPILFLFSLAVSVICAEGNLSDYHEAVSQLARKASEGDAKSIYELAKLHDYGFDTIPQDSTISTALYLESARKGYPPAMNFIGFRYFNGDGVSKDIDSALFWIRKAADLGNITAAANLGYLLSESSEIPHDREEAIKWLTIASEAGVRDAQIHLATILKDEWQNLSSDSALSLGGKYYVGNAPILGFKLIEIASKNGDPKALALLGDAYSKGRGTTYDHNKSIDYFLKAAEGGNPSAQFILAELLEIFPDAIQSQSVDSTLHAESVTMIHDPHYWYEKADSAGVVDSEVAYRLLYDF